MIFIAHRGNLNGPNEERENSPDYINEALAKGFHVEIDVWYIDGNFFLGHDRPEYQVDQQFLKNDKFYCHAKNMDALNELLRIKDYTNIFSHHSDDFVLTSNGKIWTYPGFSLCESSICCMPERCNQYSEHCFGICTDYVIKYELLHQTTNGN